MSHSILAATPATIAMSANESTVGHVDAVEDAALAGGALKPAVTTIDEALVMSVAVCHVWQNGSSRHATRTARQ